MKVLGLLLENIKIIKWPILVISLFLLMANDKLISWFGVNRFVEDYQAWIGFALLFSSMFIGLDIVKRAYNYFGRIIEMRKNEKEEYTLLLDNFHKLNNDQWVVLYILYSDRSKPCHIFDDGFRRSWNNNLNTHLIDLQSKKLIRKQQRVALENCWQLTIKAEEMLDSHPEFIKIVEEELL